MIAKKSIKKTLAGAPKGAPRGLQVGKTALGSGVIQSSLSLARKLASKLISKLTSLASSFANALVDKLEKLAKDDLLLSAALLFLPIIYMLAALNLIANIGLGKWVLPAGLLSWATVVIALHRDKSWQKIVITLLLFLAAFALIALVTSQVLDIGYDSRVYHYVAVQALLRGANPFYQPLEWVTFAYPAAHWLMSSSLVLWTNSIEASFSLNVPAMLAAFICTWRFIATLKAISRTWHLLLAMLLAANPIAIWTLFNHYNDGIFASTLLSSFMLMLTFLSQGKNAKQKEQKSETRRYYIYITLSLILLINIKFTGLLFGAILGITALAYAIAVNGKAKQARKRVIQLITIGTVAPILAVICFGFFPYATSTIHEKNPFHSTNIYDKQGNKRGSIFREVLEPEFYNKSNYEKWWMALFSKSVQGNFWHPEPLPPFSSISPRSYAKGHGSFFSGAMLLCLTLVFFIRNKGAWIIISGIFASILITEAGFSFRLAPQNWWMPIMILLFFLAQDDKDKKILKEETKAIPKTVTRAQKIMAILIAACLLQSPTLVFLYYAKESVLMKSRVYQLRKQGGWYVTKDLSLPIYFFGYYVSGLTGVGLPTLRKCPKNAQQQKISRGLVLCRP